MTAPFTYNANVQPIRLPVPGNVPTTALVLAGWGATNAAGTAIATILQTVTLPTITLAQCRAAFNAVNLDGNLVDDTNFCTGPLSPTGGVSACSGDSGGPLVYGQAGNYLLEGIVSWGVIPCGSPNVPTGVFKRVSAFYNWIYVTAGIQH